MAHNQNDPHDLRYRQVPQVPQVEETREQYMAQLRQWVNDARYHNEDAMQLWRDFVTLYVSQIRMADPNNFVTDPPTPRAPRNRAPNGRRLQRHVIAPIWKRFVAEIIDFIILLAIKTLLMMFLLETVEITSSGEASNFLTKLKDPKIAIQLSTEILVLEVIHRIIVCCYETYYITKRRATPGKKCMGIVVVKVEHMLSLHGQPEDVVFAYPCTHLETKDALFRAVLKNLLLAHFIPICYMMLVFKYNRTGYDVMSSSLVIECNPEPPLQENH